MKDMMKLAIVFLLVVGAVNGQTVQKTQLEIATVCDVLHNRGRYKDKTIGLIGYLFSYYHGMYLLDDCTEPVKSGDYIWENGVWLEAEQTPGETVFPDGFEYDEALAMKEVEEMEKRVKTNEPVEWYIVFGRIETEEKLKTIIQFGKTEPFQYGNMNSSAAQIIYRHKDIKRIK